MNIYEKLGAIQTELKAPKGQFNAFGKYAYRSCEDILEAVKPLANKHKVAVLISDQLIAIGERYYVQATATVADTETTDKIEATAYAREEQDKKGMDAMQLTGATSSYARKYALNGLFCIDDTKDSDTTNKHGKEEEKQTTEQPKKAEQPKAETPKAETPKAEPPTDIISQAQIKRLYVIAPNAYREIMNLGLEHKLNKEESDEITKICKSVIGQYGYEHTSEIKKKDYDKICKDIEQAIYALSPLPII